MKKYEKIMVSFYEAEASDTEAKIDKALAKMDRLLASIEDMKLDCDAEVYEQLCQIADMLK